jgi:hypothetical protein
LAHESTSQHAGFRFEVGSDREIKILAALDDGRGDRLRIASPSVSGARHAATTERGSLDSERGEAALTGATIRLQSNLAAAAVSARSLRDNSRPTSTA